MIESYVAIIRKRSCTAGNNVTAVVGLFDIPRNLVLASSKPFLPLNGRALRKRN
jgi:hypothetical protein